MSELTKEQLEEARIKLLKSLENSYIMYENSKKDLLSNAPKKVDRNGGRIQSDESIKKNLELMETMQQDVVDKYIAAGGKKEDLEQLGKKKKVDRKHLEELMKKESEKDEMAQYIAKMRENDTQNKVVIPEVKENNDISSYLKEEEVKKEQKASIQVQIDAYEKAKEEYMNRVESNQVKNVNENGNQSTQMYDIISLPSHGQCYRNKKDKIKVRYLTAYDENMILSPNLYKDGGFLDYLLKATVLDNEFNTDDLVQGDRDAIIVWLRGTSYGNDYPIIVTDDETGNDFETTIDLSTIKFKEFNLIGDENGYFEFTLPNSKDIIKFKFLSHKDLKFLDGLKKKESKKLTIENIRKHCNELEQLINTDEDLISYNAQTKIKDSIKIVNEEINKNYNEDEDFTFSHELTDRLLLQTVSINGITDRKYITEYIFHMNVKDASAYRKYVVEHEPGLDYTVEVERPQSLGGGSIKSFLRLDQFIFINI